MDFFDSMGEKIKESEKRWKEIDDLSVMLKELLKENKQDTGLEDKKLWCMATLITLLVDEMRPMYNVGEQAKKIQEDIESMFNIGLGDKK